ncbi:MAG TPA: hypothetical protein VKC57_12975 [Ktedonobacterales bacterium]|nr:hypothetical protein [Ktedonobacterales bacterium]
MPVLAVGIHTHRQGFQGCALLFPRGLFQSAAHPLAISSERLQVATWAR